MNIFTFSKDGFKQEFIETITLGAGETISGRYKVITDGDLSRVYFSYGLSYEEAKQYQSENKEFEESEVWVDLSSLLPQED